MARSDEAQQALDFSSPYHERLRAVADALPPRPGILAHRALLRMILESRTGQLLATVLDLATELCCSQATARRVIRDLADWGLLVVAERRDQHGFREANCYALNWAEVHAAAGRHRRCHGDRAALSPCKGGPVTMQGPPLHGDTPMVLEGGPLSQDQPLSPCKGGPLTVTAQEGRKEGGKEGRVLLSEKENSSFLPSCSSAQARADSEAQPGTADRPSLAVDSETAWREAEAGLLEAGVGGARRAVRSARDHGWQPPAVIRAIAVYQAHRERWGEALPGAILYWRVHSGPADRFDDWATWPAASKTATAGRPCGADRDAAAAARRDAERERADALRREADELARQLATARSECGQAFAALAAAELAALAGRSGVTVCPHLRRVAGPELLLAFWRERQQAAATATKETHCP